MNGNSVGICFGRQIARIVIGISGQSRIRRVFGQGLSQVAEGKYRYVGFCIRDRGEVVVAVVTVGGGYIAWLGDAF